MNALMTAPHDELEAPITQSALERHVMLLSPTMGYWKGMYQLPRKETNVEVAGEQVNNKDITVPRSKLITETYPVDREGVAWKKRFQKIESRKNSIIDRMSLPFPIHGIRIIPKKAGARFFRELFGETIGSLRQRLRKAEATGRTAEARGIQHRLAALDADNLPNTTPLRNPELGDQAQSIAYMMRVAGDEFVDQLPDIIEQIRRNNNTFHLVENKIPEAGQMRSRFYIDCVPIELAGRPETASVTELDLEEHQDLVRSAVSRHVEEAIETMIREPREELARTLAELEQLIARDGRVRSNSFNQVREAIAKIREFDFVANPVLLRRMTELDQLLGAHVPTSLDSVSAAANGFTAAIQGFRAEVEDAQRMDADIEEFGRPTRAIRL